MNLNPWVSLIIASCLEVCWIYSLKLLDFKKITSMHISRLFTEAEGWLALLPLLGYIFFGLGNIYFFSYSMKGIPPSTAFAAWMGLALVLTKVVDVSILRHAWSWPQVFCFLLILAGVAGLKWFEKV
ncbi:MAG: SMR family transporter [Saprospiraceae bacterium]